MFLGRRPESVAYLDKKPDAEPRVNDDIVTAVGEILHGLNTVMEYSSAANAQRFRNLDAGNQGDHVHKQDFTDDEEEPSLPKPQGTLRIRAIRLLLLVRIIQSIVAPKRHTCCQVPQYHNNDNLSSQAD